MSTIATIFNNIRSIVESVGLFDILDIVIVAMLIYAILSSIRSSSAMRIASAIVVLLLVTWFTGLVKMRVLNFILSNILEIGIIALVIVFQPELRRVLERVGTTSLTMLTNQKKDLNAAEKTIDSTVSACGILSRERTGVLLVFERRLPLEDYFKSGTIIDAEISSELLRNLFFTNASLHDGAVIVRQDRIAAAGCVLPLTENTNISSDLGTRHRAGIGMSEHSDAVVVIVSEETGIISVAVGGMLKRGLTPDTLRKVLEMELMDHAEEKEDDSILNRLRNWAAKKLAAREEADHETKESEKK
ncbi:MAG: diadenylate cyclase CdaA [Oscillospiraceae bacterium]|nr:diadenylate cyclase CdaA [Oscillospiraceae bacterium]